jgi:hypothetical protein
MGNPLVLAPQRELYLQQMTLSSPLRRTKRSIKRWMPRALRASSMGQRTAVSRGRARSFPQESDICGRSHQLAGVELSNALNTISSLTHNPEPFDALQQSDHALAHDVMIFDDQDSD